MSAHEPEVWPDFSEQRRRQAMEANGWKLFEACCGFEVWARQAVGSVKIVSDQEAGGMPLPTNFAPSTARELSAALERAATFAENEEE